MMPVFPPTLTWEERVTNGHEMTGNYYLKIAWWWEGWRETLERIFPIRDFILALSGWASTTMVNRGRAMDSIKTEHCSSTVEWERMACRQYSIRVS